MKTQIIQLEPEDDHHSAREKLRWVKSPRVVLIWPGRGRTLIRRLDLVLLQRQSQQLGIQLGLITYDPQVSDIAAELGLPVFENIEEIDQQTWTRPSRAPGRIEQDISSRVHTGVPSPAPPRQDAAAFPDWLRALVFGITAVILLAAIAASLPSARITLDPPLSVKMGSYQIAIGTGSAQSAALPAERTLVEVSASLRVPTSGEASSPDARAAGDVEFTNVSTEELSLPSGTRLRILDGAELTYETTASATIPAGEVATIPVVALDPGPAGNLKPGMPWALEGELGLLIDAQNPEAITGGSLTTRRAVSAADLSAALDTTQSGLLQTARDEMERSLRPGQILVPGSLRPSHTLSSSQDHSVGEIANSLEVSMTLEVEALVIESAVLNQALEILVRQDLGPGSVYQPASLSILQLAPVDLQQLDPVQLAVEVRVGSYIELDRAAFAERLRGIGRDKIDQVIQEVEPGVSVHELQLRPAWMPVLPFFEFQIQIALPWEVEA